MSVVEEFRQVAVTHRRCFWLDGGGAREWSGRRSLLGWLEGDDVSLTYSARTGEVTPGPDARVLLRFAGGGAAVVEGVHGSGKFMLYAFDPATDGSDLALSPMFLPLLHRTVVYLAGETGRQKLVYNVGERIELQIPLAAGGAEGAASGGRDFTVTTPSSTNASSRGSTRGVLRAR